MPGTLAHAEIGEAGRNHDGLLRSADEDVDTPCVDVEVSCAQAGDAVDHEEGVSSAEQLRDRFNVVAHGGRSLCSLHVNDAMLGLERFFYLGEVEGFAVGGAVHVDLASECLGEACPALAEFSSGEYEHAIARGSEIRDRRFHGTGA